MAPTEIDEIDSDSEDCPCKDFNPELDHLPMHRYMGPFSSPLLKKGPQLPIANRRIAWQERFQRIYYDPPIPSKDEKYNCLKEELWQRCSKRRMHEVAQEDRENAREDAREDCPAA